MINETIKQHVLKNGSTVSYREWEVKTSNVLVIYLHGIESHSGWFTDAIDELYARGIHVIGIDRQGSGLDKEFRGHMNCYRGLIQDLKHTIEAFRAAYPHKKIVLMGICWGAKLAVLLAAYYPQLINGLLLIAPGIKTNIRIPWGQKSKIFLFSFFAPRASLEIPVDESLFTNNQKYVTFIQQDTLKLRRVTARFLWETGRMDRRLRNIARKLNVPVFILVAGDDRIINYEQTLQWFNRIKSLNKKIKRYPNCSHILFFEQDITPIINDLEEWIKKNYEN